MHKPRPNNRVAREGTNQEHGGQTESRKKIQLPKLQPCTFVRRDLVWRMTSNDRKKDKWFSANWDGRYKVREDIGGGAYRLEQLSGDPISNTLNTSHLKFYFSSGRKESTTCNPKCTLFPHLTFFPKECFG